MERSLDRLIARRDALRIVSAMLAKVDSLAPLLPDAFARVTRVGTRRMATRCHREIASVLDKMRSLRIEPAFYAEPPKDGRA